MRAARLTEAGQPLRIEQVDDPPLPLAGVVVRVAAAGVCHSDVDIIRGRFPLPPPLTPGHEVAGVVEAVGAGARRFAPGDVVAVHGGWGCGSCRLCLREQEQICDLGRWMGIGVDGGYAELVAVPHERHLHRLDTLDPIEAVALTDAGVTAHHAVGKTLAHLAPEDTAVVIGVGGLGHIGLQVLKVCSPAQVAAVDVQDDKLALAGELGADHVIDGRGDLAAQVKQLTGGVGARAIVDFVGTDDTLAASVAALAPAGVLVIAGIKGGTLPVRFLGVPFETTIATSLWGSRRELADLLALAEQGRIRTVVERHPLEDANTALDRLERGEVHGRAVLVP